MITLDNISKSYGRNQVLNGINLEFVSGQVYGVVGKNGAGKTTLFRCIAALEKYEGRVSYQHGVLKTRLDFCLLIRIFSQKLRDESICSSSVMHEM